MTPRIFRNFTLQLQQCMLDVEIFQGRKRKLSPVRHQTCVVPSRNHEPSSELLRFVRGVCPIVRQNANFYTASSWQHDITSTKVSRVSGHFLLFLFKMPCHSMHTYACVHVVRPILFKIPSNLLHMELTGTQVHIYDFSNRFGQALHVDVVQI